MPQALAGIRTDPPPSVPSASGPWPLATAAAAPPLDPPQVRSRLQGLRETPETRLVVMPLWPRAGVVVLPRRIPPAAFRRATATASRSGTLPAKTAEPNVVRTPAVGTRSLTE